MLMKELKAGLLRIKFNIKHSGFMKAVGGTFLLFISRSDTEEIIMASLTFSDQI